MLSVIAALAAYLLATHITTRHHDRQTTPAHTRPPGSSPSPYLATPPPIISVPLGLADFPHLDGSGDDVPVPAWPVVQAVPVQCGAAEPLPCYQTWQWWAGLLAVMAMFAVVENCKR